jgi:hypothetical protein
VVHEGVAESVEMPFAPLPRRDRRAL